MRKTEPADERRFDVRDTLGRGGMGVVYRAYDRRRRHEVALKVLPVLEGARLFRFKQEFRSLAGIVHPNLCTLYDLHADGDTWMFSMELVVGTTFRQFIRPHQHLIQEPSAGTPDDATRTQQPGLAPRAEHVDLARAAFLRAVPDMGRLRSAAAQLALAISTIHRAGKLHRDLKPSNVLVDGAGRIVVCDFGLVSELGASGAESAGTWGTPSYMSPEQVIGARQDEASDWYSLGVMLYEVIAGQAPFVGAPRDVMDQKCSVDAPALTSSHPGLDPDLADLVMALLARDPTARPPGDAVLARLGVGAAASSPTTLADRAAPATHRLFVGRQRELAILDEAFADSARRSAAVLVGGGSGVGKSALVRHFLRRHVRGDEVVVLAGRCYEREAVPHGALDGIVDALSSALFNATDAELNALAPREVGALLRLFPVLERLKPFAAAAAAGAPLPRDPQELRARGFGALRILLARMARDRRVAVFIDDLQWGDVDSAAFLTDLVLHPAAPALLLVATYRDDDVAHSALLDALIGAGGSLVGAEPVRRVQLGGLANDDAIALAEAQLGGGPGGRAAQIAAEAGGHPLFLAELARTDSSADGAGDGPDASPQGRLATLLQRRWRRLDPAAQAFLAAASIAGGPLPVDVVSRVAGVADESAVLARLRAEALIRVRHVETAEVVEPYHDRVRSAVADALAADERRDLHRSFARILEHDPRADSTVVLEHWLGAGDHERAGAVAVEAAGAAEANLAFHRAATLHRIALELGAVAGSERSAWLTRMGDNLLHAGDLAAAADAYIDAAAQGGADSIDLHRRAFECLLRVGDVERGLEVAGRVVGACGLTLPGSQRAAIVGALVEQARLAISGRRFVTVAPEDRDPDALLRIDVCRSLSSGLGFVLPITSAVFHKKAVRYALRSGDSRRAGLAMIHELGIAAITGSRSRKRVQEIREAIERLPDFQCHPTLAGYLEAARGLAAFLQGDFVEASGLLERGCRAMLEDPATVRWEIDLAKIYRMAAHLYCGRLRELTTVGPVLLREALDRDNQYLANALRAWRSNALWLALDRPDEARANVECVAHITKRKPFHLVHYFEMTSSVQIDLYAGRAADAWQRLVATWPQLEGSLLLRMQISRIETSFLRGRCALAMGRDAPADRPMMFAEVDRCVARLRREKHGWSDAYAELLTGLAAAQRGDPERALARLAAARSQFDALGMAMHAAVARRRLGELGARRDDVAAADVWMQSENVRSPDRMTQLWAPGP